MNQRNHAISDRGHKPPSMLWSDVEQREQRTRKLTKQLPDQYDMAWVGSTKEGQVSNTALKLPSDPCSCQYV